MRSLPGPDSGSIAAFTTLLCAALLALAGLVAEGGQVLTARESAMAEAEQAARVGASRLSTESLHDGQILDHGSGPVKAAEYVMSAAGHPGTAVLSGSTVTTVVTPFTVRTPLLAIAGVPSIRVSARASAHAVAG